MAQLISIGLDNYNLLGYNCDSFYFFLNPVCSKKNQRFKSDGLTYAVPFWVALGEIIINSSFPDTNIIFGGVIIAFALLMLISDNTTANI